MQIFIQTDFRISSPEKFGIHLNFRFALRPMGRPQKKKTFFSQLVQPIGLKFCTHVIGDPAHKLQRQNFEFHPLKIWRPFKFFASIVSCGMKT